MSTTAPQMGTARKLAGQLAAAIRQGKYATGSKLPSVRQLARQHAVSVGTVQRALSQLEANDLISSSPRRRGLVKGLGNVSQGRKAGEQSLQPTTLNLGIVFPTPARSVPVLDETESWTSHIVRAVHASASAAKYDVLTLAAPTEGDSPEALVNRLRGIRSTTAGLVIFQIQQVPGLLQALDSIDLPWVSVDRPSPDTMHNFVSSDFTRAGHVVGKTFAACGFERVLMLMSNFTDYRSSAELSSGFMQSYLEIGRPTAGIEYRVCDSSHETAGYEQTRQFLAGGGRPQAILSSGDRTALGAIRACREFGLRCPEDVSVIGGTGLELSRYTSPALSVIQQPMQQIGNSAVKMLLEMVGSHTRRVPGILFACDFIQRQSLCLDAASESKLIGDWKKQHSED
jgi:DNA-binding LacI/PurR family transcriptional regulator